VAKGGDFEREICQRLSLWWTEGERDDIFWRSSISGARATSRQKAGKSTAYQYGDVAPTDPMGAPLCDLFVIELKRGYTKEESIHDLLDKKETRKSLLWFEEWLMKVFEDTEAAGAGAWLLITRRDRRDAMVWMEESTRGSFEEDAGVVDLELPPCTKMELMVRKGDVRRRVSIFGMLLEKFLGLVGREDIIELGKIL